MTQEEKDAAKAKEEEARIAAFVAVLGPEFEVKPPPTFAEREDVVVAWAESGSSQPKIRRVFGGVVGLCYPEIAKAAGADYDALDLDMVKFGAKVYEYLRARATIGQISVVANALYLLCVEARSPRAKEVKDKVGFTDRPAEHSTDGP